jgi:peptide-methionine (S)-S-oxide reductase
MGLRIDPSVFPKAVFDEVVTEPDQRRTIVLGSGSFWCGDALYRMLSGVLSVRPGYAGGSKGDANYQAVSSGRTGHAFVVEVVYDPAKRSLGQILQVFFSIAHDPTQRDRQGSEVGTQFRSAIYFTTPAQRKAVRDYIAQLQSAGVFNSLIATTIEPLASFYEAEDAHHDYVAKNPGRPHVRQVSLPKLAKLKKLHPEFLRP